MPTRKRALVTGVTGQDGSYMAEFLISKGYEVHGILRRSSTFNTSRIDHIFEDRHVKNRRLHLHFGDLADGSNLNRLLEKIHPHEVYHLGAQTHVKVSFELPEYTADITGVGTVRLLDALRETRIKAKFYQASSSEMFGSAPAPQSEKTEFRPRSPYAASKVFGHHMTVNYREAYGMFACSGILFNHESPRRGPTFVTRKIARAAARIAAGIDKKVYLGNLDAKRDWGYAPEYVEAMWLMLQQDKPDDYVVATGETHTVREFAKIAFERVGLNWKKFVVVDPIYFRPTEVDHLCGNASKARRVLKWRPRTTFKRLVELMVDAEVEAIKRRQLLVPAEETQVSRRPSKKRLPSRR
jgi:GDPmannose 4,6-dehydratase